MYAYALPILYTLLLWWLSTGIILFLDRLDRRTFAWSMAGASALLGGSLWGVAATGANTSVIGAYLAFACALAVWGWQLVSFYMGYLTGPRKTACQWDLIGFRRFVEAVRTGLYHELTICFTAAILVLLTRGQANQMAVWTFVVLWWMHLSAKLNLFFGVPNLGEDLLPDHLRYLQSFMTRKSMNLLFPISVTASTIITVLLVQQAVAVNATPFEVAGFTMLATLMALAIAEHWFLVAPVPSSALWQWGMKASSENDAIDFGKVVAKDRAQDFEAKASTFSDGSSAKLDAWASENTSIADSRSLRTALRASAPR
jgi:putative photosynthetic complex assembly protein 2